MTLRCPHCGKPYKSEGWLRKHIDKEHSAGLEACPNCDKIAFNGTYCISCGYPGKVSKRGRGKKK